MKTTHTDAFNKIMGQCKDKPKKEKPMKPTTLNPDHKLSESLSKCTIRGNVLSLPPVTDPLPHYTEMRKALINAGGVYKRSSFVFPSDVLPYLERITGGEKVNIKKEFQFFATPPHLAERLVEMADISSPDLMVLEPSAGQGAIVKALLAKEPGLIVHAYELMDINRSIVEKIKDCVVLGDDFLKRNVVHEPLFDRIVANPPFSKNQDIEHIMYMYKSLNKGGRIVTIASKHWQFSKNKKETEFRNWLEEIGAVWEDVEAGEFKESGTNIATCIIIIDK